MTALVPALAQVVGIRREGTSRITSRFTFWEAIDPIPAFNGAPTDLEFACHGSNGPPLAFEHLKSFVAINARCTPLAQLPLPAGGPATTAAGCSSGTTSRSKRFSG